MRENATISTPTLFDEFCFFEEIYLNRAVINGDFREIGLEC